MNPSQCYFLVWTFMILVVQHAFCLSAKATKLSRAANCFSLDLYRSLPQTTGSLISSPFSADVVMSMLLSGAGGTTASQLMKALGYDDQQLSVADVGSSFKEDLSSLQSNAGNTLNIANSIWIQNSFPVKQEFVTSVTKNFDAKEQNLDFKGNPKVSTDTINEWVNGKTNGLIPKLFNEDLDTSTIMVLVNAIYFKGQWANKFDKENTKDSPFYNNGNRNTKKNVPLMNQQDSFKYKFDDTLKAQVLEMDYKGGDTSMVLILPDSTSNITALEQSLSCQLLQDGYKTDYSSLVDVTMPKFDAQSDFDLIPPLKKLKINKIFSSDANLTGISPDIFVSVVVQKAVIKVYEEGSEAAAATGVGVMESDSVDLEPPQPIIFRADRPFLYFIRHNPTNVILFMGNIKYF